MEGVVIKKYLDDGRMIAGKYTSPAFKEMNKNKVRVASSIDDIVQSIADIYKTEARYHKAVQHLAEKGELKESSEDIGKLVKEVTSDLLEECGEDIKEILFKKLQKSICRGVVKDFAAFYLKLLREKQFKGE